MGRSRFCRLFRKTAKGSSIINSHTSGGRLSNNQSGNKKLHSTETPVIETSDMILQAMDNKKLSAMVLLDMSEAFDSVDHKPMISKLQDAGASSSCTEWFRSYLSGRQ